MVSSTPNDSVGMGIDVWADAGAATSATRATAASIPQGVIEIAFNALLPIQAAELLPNDHGIRKGDATLRIF
ncbi:MAG: hypothetical protein DHS20C21_08100 [Gemmatimonadota bacterium]|nr:MAG: hypothetical protein DHS20C21_08100 [Gemmatimonadota bacterium]